MLGISRQLASRLAIEVENGQVAEGLGLSDRRGIPLSGVELDVTSFGGLGRSVVAQVTVFVDDAVLGRFPPLCVKDGVPTADGLTVHSPIQNGNGFGIVWLLLLGGPLGWLGLIILSIARRPDVLTVQLPLSQTAHERMRTARRNCWIATSSTLLFAVVALIAFGRDTSGGRTIAAAFGLLALVALAQLTMVMRRLRSASVDISLDASRRWVTLSRVHPGFADHVIQRRDFSQIR